MVPTDFSSLSDNELAKKSSEDVSYFEELVDRYERPLLRYILRISYFSSAEAEEVLQEIFLKVWRNLQEYDDSLSFSSWVYRIAHNETISLFRKEKSRGREQKVEWDEDLFSNLASNADVEGDIDHQMNSKAVRKVLDMLPEKYRSVLVLKFLEEKSYDEISDILRVPSGTVATNLNRAKKAFAEAYRSSSGS